MDSSNINALINMADKALVDFDSSDLSGNLGDRVPPVIPAASTTPSNIQNTEGGTSNQGISNQGGVSNTTVEFTDSMADSLDSPDAPVGIRVPRDPVDSVSSADTRTAPRSVTGSGGPHRDMQNQNRPSAQQVRQRRPTYPASHPPLRVPNNRPSPEQTMRSIATRHNLQGGQGGQPNQPQGQGGQLVRQVRPPTRPPNPAPAQPAQPAKAAQPVQSGHFGKSAQDDAGIIDPNQPVQPDQSDQSQQAEAPAGDVTPVLPDHMTSLMGYSIPTNTLYLILVLVLIAVGLYFWTAPPAKKDKNKKKKKDDEEENEDDE